MIYFDMAGFEGGQAALNCALLGIRPERLVFASDNPQDFTGVNTDTGKGMSELKNISRPCVICSWMPAKNKPSWEIQRQGC